MKKLTAPKKALSLDTQTLRALELAQVRDRVHGGDPVETDMCHTYARAYCTQGCYV